MNDDLSSLPASPARFREVFEQAPISMQLVALGGRTLLVNQAWEDLWQGTYGDGLKQFVLGGDYNLLTDPQLEEKGVTAYLRRAFAGESVRIPPILYDPNVLGIRAKPRWVSAVAHPLRDERGEIVEIMLMHEDITDRREAEETLRLSEERFRSLVTASSQVVWTCDADGMVVEDSPSWREFTGQSYDEWKGAGWLDAVHPDDRAQVGRVMAESLAAETVYETEYRLRRADGEYRCTAVRAVPLRRPDGSVREWIGANIDVTDQRRAQESVRNNEQRMRFMLDSMQQKIFTAAPNGRVDYVNPAWSAYTGLPQASLAGSGWTTLLHADDADHSAMAWQQALACATPLHLEQRIRRADGKYRWHLTRARPIPGESGEVAMWIGSSTDIDEVKSAEAEMARRLLTERRHAAVLSKVAAASHTLHTSRTIDAIARELVERVRDLLEAHQAVISLTADENWAQSINEVSLSEKYAHWRGYATTPTGDGIYSEVCRTNKPLRLTQDELLAHPAFRNFGEHAADHPPLRGWLAVPLIGHDGRNLGLLQVSDKYEGDFTAEDEAILTQLAAIAATGFENARLYGSLQEQHRRKDEFLAMLAHELRNPLAPIRAAADLLSFAPVNEHAVRQTSAVISRQVRHMSSLVDDLLDVSRVTRGLVELSTAHLDIKRVVADAAEQVRPLVEAKRHELTVTLSAAPAHVRGDHKRLVQILTNILNNAAKYTPNGGAIHVRTETTEREVILSVQDNGIGIAPELQADVFNLFAQAERSSDRSQGGLGIGLALVRSLVELHGGSVTCHSDGAGRGSKFVVTLPRLSEQARLAHGSPEDAIQPAPVRRLRILVVDDNVDAAQMLAMYLEAAGHELLVEHAAGAALERALRERPDVCLLDLGLPDMDGNALASQLRAQSATAGATLIAVTGYGSDRDKETALASGFHHHLVKPVDTAALAALLAAARSR
jgi:PAS domain S-box-containing protein